MTRRATFVSLLASAAIAAFVTALAFVAFDEQEPPTGAGTSVSILNGRPEPQGRTATPPVPAELSVPLSNFIRSSVDWAAIYTQAVPSLVTVQTEEGAGSGFFVSEDGHIITNFHVVADAEQLFVFMQDGSRLEAEYIAKDAGNDLALLKVDPEGLEVVVPTYGRVDELQVGDPVGALGAPFSLPNTLTVGIVSAVGRNRPSGGQTWEPLRDTIQTDAALNPGNSGGMLIDERGRVIGIPTQIESPERVSSGIGFAVSADAMLRSLPTLLAGEDFERSYLGVSLQERDGELEILDVTCGSAAEDAGLRSGDHVLKVNDEPAHSLDLLIDVMASIKPSDELVITIIRGSNEMTVEATAGSWPTEPPTGGCG
ncbi:MAG: trypsin-like peptidase domain-containing protein [Chloroflexi bacterium]|nr:trypsin-like peptidase domain-containing protein [Chloroflexota bacterium]